MECGIYLVLNTASGKKYVGSSKSLKNRRYQHWSDLRRGVHRNNHLQKAWVCYGPDSFKFLVLEYCDPEDRMDREEWWINLLGTRDQERGYNVTEARPGGGMRGRLQSAETRAKISAAMTGKKKSPEHAAQCRLASKGKTFPPLSAERRAKLSAARQGMSFSEEHKANLSAAHMGKTTWMKGRTHTPDAREKIKAGLAARKAREV